MISHEVASEESPERLFVTLILMDVDEQSSVSMNPSGTPSQSCETSARIPNVLWMVNSTIVFKELLFMLATSSLIIPISGSALSPDGLMDNLIVWVLCRSSEFVWNVPSSSSSSILCPVSLS